MSFKGIYAPFKSQKEQQPITSHHPSQHKENTDQAPLEEEGEKEQDHFGSESCWKTKR